MTDVATMSQILEAARGAVVPVAESGPWSVERFKVTEEDSLLDRMRNFRTGRWCRPGIYTKLCHQKRGVVMSDTVDELGDLSHLFWNASGRVVVNGLGLGCAVRGILAKLDVSHVDIVEIDPDVIALVAPTLPANRVTIHQDDAFTKQWPKGYAWTCAWHDVWDELCTDNLNSKHARPGSYATLNRRYARRVQWQGAWGQGFLQWQRGMGR